MRPATYLVFGDLHGRVLPAFRLAQAWSREHGVALDGLLQVGDLGYFPDPGRFDKATQRHAERDPLEGGVRLVRRPSEEADDVFAERALPRGDVVHRRQSRGLRTAEGVEAGRRPRADSFAVDAYGKLRCIRDGRVAELPGGLRVGACGASTTAHRRPRADPAGAASAVAPRRRLRLRRFDVLLDARVAARRHPGRQRQRRDRRGHPLRPAGVRLLRPLPPHRPSGRGGLRRHAGLPPQPSGAALPGARRGRSAC